MLGCCTECHSGKDGRVDHDDIPCSRFIRTMAGFLDGELCADDEQRSRQHVQACPDCADYLRNYELTIQLARESASDGLDAPPPESLVDSVLAARRRMH